MRPVQLVVEGFAAFRDRVEIDFTGTDFFALVGPTGSGKSTVLDAIGFALYGSVPRYDREGLVAPVITQGANEARVRSRSRSTASSTSRRGSSTAPRRAGGTRNRPGSNAGRRCSRATRRSSPRSSSA